MNMFKGINKKNIRNLIKIKYYRNGNEKKSLATYSYYWISRQLKYTVVASK